MRDVTRTRDDNGNRQWAAALGGSALLFYALRRQNWSSPFLGVAGVALLYRGATGHSPMARLVEEVSDVTRRGIEVHKAVTIRRTPEDVYRFWQRLENLPRFMEHLEEVEEVTEGRSRWKARMTGGVPLSWEAVTVRDEAPSASGSQGVLEWRTEEESAVEHYGQVLFVPKEDGKATELHVQMRYMPPMGAAGAAVAQLLNTVTEQQIKEEIRHCKHLLEAGEIPTIEGQSSGRVRA